MMIDVEEPSPHRVVKSVPMLSIATREKSLGQFLYFLSMALVGLVTLALPLPFSILFWLAFAAKVYLATKNRLDVGEEGIVIHQELEHQFIPYEEIEDVTVRDRSLSIEYRRGGNRLVGPLPRAEVEPLRACIMQQWERWRPVRIAPDALLQGDVFRVPDSSRLRDTIEEEERVAVRRREQ